MLLNYTQYISEEISSHLLFLSVYNGFLGIIKLLLRNNANVNCVLHSGLSGDFHIDNNQNILGKLLSRHGISHCTTYLTPLHIACLKSRKDIVDVLVQNGAKCNVALGHDSALHYAATAGNSEIVESLLKAGSIVNAKDSKNRTAFELAVAYSDLSAVKVFLELAEIDINSKGNDGWSPLHIAAQEGHVEIAKYLIEKGAKIEAKNYLGSTPVHIAARDGHMKLVEYFLSLDEGLGVESRGSANQTLLHSSAATGKLDIIKLLIERKADVNAKDANGQSPLHMAARFGHKDAAEHLLKSHCFYNSLDKYGQSPLDVSSEGDITTLLESTKNLFKGSKENIMALVNDSVGAGAFIDAMDSNSGTSLQYAAWKGFDDIVKFLLKQNCDPNIIGKRGNTALHYAAKFSHYEIVLNLLMNGAVFDILSEARKEPIDLTECKSIINLIKFIKKCFKRVKCGDSKLISDLKKIDKIETVKAIMKTQSKEKETIVAIALRNNFPKVKELKNILQKDITDKMILAELLFSQEKYDEGLILYETILESRKEVLGQDDPGVLEIEENIALILYKKQEYHKSLSLYEHVYLKFKQIFGEDHRDTLHVKSCIALVLHRLGKNAESLDFFQSVRKKQEELLSSDDPHILETKSHLALVLTQLNKLEQALSLNYEVYEEHKKTKGKQHPLTLVSYNNIAMTLAFMGRHDESINIYRKVYEERIKVLGPSHSDTLRALHNVATTMSYKNPVEALNLFNNVIEKQKAALGTRHRDVFQTHLNIANTLIQEGNTIGSLKFLRESYNLGKSLLGIEHPEVILASTLIEAIKLSLNSTGFNIDDLLKKIQNDFLCAVDSGDSDTVIDLIRRGAFINERNSEGLTPLQFAVNSNNLSMVHILLDNCADATLASDKGNTPLHTAVKWNNIRIMTVLLKNVNSNQLSDFINCKTKSGGTTALHIASMIGSLDAVRCLLQYGAMFNITNNESKTPLQVSKNEQVSNELSLIQKLFNVTKQGSDQIYQDLINLAPDTCDCIVNARNCQGRTLLQVAIENKHSDIAARILAFIKKY